MRARRIVLVGVAVALLAPPVAAHAALIGPAVPVTGAPGVGHGGSSCLAESNLEGAMGKAGGQTWYQGGGKDPAVDGCPHKAGLDPASDTDLPPFDTTRWATLHWGPEGPRSGPDPTLGRPGLSLNGTSITESEVMTFSAADSDRANGKLVYLGSTTMEWCIPSNCPGFTVSAVPTRLTIQFSRLTGEPVALKAPADLGLDDEVGGLVEVTSALTKYKVNLLMEADSPTSAGVVWQPALTMYNALNHNNAVPGGQRTGMSFSGRYWWESRPPVADFTVPAPQDGQPVTFTDTSSDPDGAIASRAWDTNGDGAFSEGTDATATATYGPGTHTVRLQVTDDDGVTTTAERSFTIAAPPSAGGGTTPPPPAGGGTPPPQGGGPLPPPPIDRTAPVVRGAAAKQKLGAVLRSGLKCSLTANEAGRARLVLALSRALQRKLKLAGTIGSATLTLKPGANPCTIRLVAKAKRKLRKVKKLTFVLTITATDAAGNAAPTTISITLKK